jgi:Bifunctional DNA primase/polymerase, N-terminal
VTVQRAPASTLAPAPSRLLAAALRYGALGWPVVPKHTPDVSGGCLCARRPCSKPGKHPRTRHGLHDASTDPAQIRAWWDLWPAANVGIATGRLVVLDVDGPDGRDALAELERTHGPLPSTLSATSGHGLHLYFDAGELRIRSSAGALSSGLDVRGHGGTITAPPSLHASGRRYKWRTRRRPATLPSWLADLLLEPSSAASTRGVPLPALTDGDRRRRYFDAALRAELADIAAAQPGSRNDTLNRAGFRLAQLAAAGHVSLDELHDRLLDAALVVGLEEREALATIASALAAGQQRPRPIRR